MLEEVVSLYEAYLEEFRRLERERKPFEGAFGSGGGPRDYPCHEKFAQDLDRLLKGLEVREITSGQAGQVLRYICCTAPVRWESESAVYWMLLAAQGLTVGLIQRLDAEDARTLYGEYRQLYPRRRRLPVQGRVLSALKDRAK